MSVSKLGKAVPYSVPPPSQQLQYLVSTARTVIIGEGAILALSDASSLTASNSHLPLTDATHSGITLSPPAKTQCRSARNVTLSHT